MSGEKKYVNGSAKEIVFKDGNSILSVWIDLDDARAKGLVSKTKSGKEGISFTIAKRDEEGKYGDTHYMYHKEYDPTAKNKPQSSKPARAVPASMDGGPKDDGGGLPF